MSDCETIREILKAGRLPEGADVGAHLTSCPGCRELADGQAALGRALARSQGADGEPDSRLALAAFSLPEERGLERLRSLATPARIALVLGLSLLIVGFELARGASTGARLFPSAALAALLFLAVVLLLEPLGRPNHPGRRALTTIVLAASPFAIAFGLLGARAGAPSGFGSTGGALACFGYGALLSAPLLVLLYLFERRPRVPLLAGALAGAAAGAAANVVLELHCANAHPAHLVLGHATIGIAWMLAAAAATRFGPNRG